jgi:hypothetical protein
MFYKITTTNWRKYIYNQDTFIFPFHFCLIIFLKAWNGRHHPILELKWIQNVQIAYFEYGVYSIVFIVDHWTKNNKLKIDNG